MKNLFVLVLTLFILNEGFAQRKNTVLVKWAPASLAAGKLTLGGEYNFKRKASLELIIGIPTGKNYGFDFDNRKSDLESKAFSLLAGYRYYFGKRAAGLYVEPYLKYLHHQASGMLEGSLNGETAKFDTRSDYKGMGLGAQLGVQFFIAKKITFDFFLLGPEANSAKTSIKATDVANILPWTEIQASEAEQDLKNALDDLPIIGDKVEVSVNQGTKTVSASYNGFLPGFRFGASIGFRF